MMCRVQPGTVAARLTSRHLGWRGATKNLSKSGEKPLSETLDAPVSITSFPPVEHRKNRRHCNRINRLSIRNKRRIVFRLELTQSIVVREYLCEWDRDQVKSRVRWNSGEEVDWLPDHAHERGNFTGLELLQCSRRRSRPALPAPPGAGRRSSLSDLIASRRSEIHLLAA